MTDILILVGTESGNAQMVADLLKDELGRQGHKVEVLNRGTVAEAGFEQREVVLVCCATHGDGELPDNIIPMHDSLKTLKPDLKHIRYGVIALGDQTYHDTFCFAGKAMDTLFAELGATRLGERLEIDACTQPLPDEEALEWMKEWATLL
jgi:MioC protein